MYDLKGFGKRIEEMRKKKGMTQENLAERLGVTSQAVSKWENSLCYPDIELIPTICAIFEISLDDIFGKIKKDVSHLSFPPVFKGLNLVATFANVACYSDKKIIQTGVQGESAPSTVEFKDGSLAEFSSRRIVNKGAGRIILKSLDDGWGYSEQSNSSKLEKLEKLEEKKLMPNHLDIEYGKVKKLDCAVPNGNCEINKTDGDRTTVCIEGYPEFVDLFNFDFFEAEQTLKIYYDKQKRDQLGHEMSKWDVSKNKISINLAFDGETLEGTDLFVDGLGDIKLNVSAVNCGMTINGSGNITTPVSFTNLAATINGSGDITAVDAVNLSATINGSGDIGFRDIVNGSFTINGSGEIKFKDAINGAATINGSGDISFRECDAINIEIHGSGDFDIDKVNKSVAVKIHGLGDVNIKSGEVETFDVYIDNGEVKAKGVTTDKANIEIPNNGKVELGRVKIESIEKCGDNAEVIIHQRG